MTISNDPNAKLSRPEQFKTRTDFTKRPSLWGKNYSATEKKLIEFTERNKADVQVYTMSKSHGFMKSWLAESIKYYTDLIIENQKIDISEVRGIIKGQKEILETLEAIERSQTNKTED